MTKTKRFLMTLAALFAMTAGAWADGTLQVTELKASDISAWSGDNTTLSAADLPGFTAVSDEEVVNIPAPLTNGAIFMIYAFNGTNIKFVNYYNGAQVYKGEDYYNRDNIAYIAFDAGYIIYYTGTAPSLGWANLSADGNGGVKVDTAGNNYLVVAVDTAAKTCVIEL